MDQLEYAVHFGRAIVPIPTAATWARWSSRKRWTSRWLER